MTSWHAARRAGLRRRVDKITTVRRVNLGERIGELDDADVVRPNRAVVTFLEIANSPQAS